MTHIYVNDSLVDIYTDSLIAISIQRSDINNLTARFVGFTNQINLPPTPNNLTIFGLQDVKTGSTIPYTKLSCNVVINGYEVLSYAKCSVVSFEGNIQIRIFEGDVDSFNLIKGKSLFDVMSSTVYQYEDTAWTKAGIDARRASTSDIISAVVGWGNGFNTDFFWPCYFYRTAILAIANYIGISSLDFASNSLLNDDIEDLVFAYLPSKVKYNENINQLIFANAQSVGTQNLLATGAITFMTSVTSEGTVDIYNSVNGRIEVTEDVELNVSMFLNATATRTAPTDTFEIRLVKDVGGVFTTLASQSYTLAGAPTLVFSVLLSATVELANTDKVYLRFFTTSGTPTLLASNGTATAQATNKVFRFNVHWAYLLPSELTPEALIKDWIVRFGIVFKIDNTGLRIKKLNDILADRANAIDWTGKFVREGKVELSSNYARRNLFKYKNDADLNTLGRGSIDIDSGIIEDEKTIYTSLFNGTINRDLLGIRCAYFQAFEGTPASITDNENEIPLTLLTIRDKLANEPGVVFNTLSRTDYKVGYFVDSTLSKDTGFQYFIDNNYSVLEDSLQRNRSTERFYNLNEKDIFEYDPFKIIFDNGEYYIIDKIENFVPGKITKVKMFRV